MEKWVIVAITVVGIIGQWFVSSRASARRSGEDAQQLKSISSDVVELKDTTRDHETRLSHVEGRLAPRHGAD
jgi:hypothetical protein